MRTRVLAVLLAGAVLAVAGPFARAAEGGPNDPLFPETEESFGQWGLRQINGPAAWADGGTKGAGAVIAVVDNGVDLTHPDLGANMLSGATVGGCKKGKRPCGNGRWKDSDDPLASPQHGTHVSGIAAAVADNGEGIAGVAPEAKILPVNVFDEATAEDEDVAFGIRYAIQQNVSVINLSLGDLVPVIGMFFESETGDAVQEALDAGIVVVAAAGNEDFPLCSSPSDAEGVLCVAATDLHQAPADYSNLPVKGDQLALRAPGGGTADFFCGGGIVSTVPDDFHDEFCYEGHDAGYQDLIGTSMAAPHVSGVAALLRSFGCNATQTRDIIVDTAWNPLTDQHGSYDPVYGYGIVDAQAAVKAAQVPIGGCSTSSVSGGGELRSEPPKKKKGLIR